MAILALSLVLIGQSQPKTNRYAACALYSAREIYVIGGSEISTHQPVRQVDILNPVDGKWRLGTFLLAPRDFAAITSTGSAIAFAGGVTADGQPSNRFDLYSLASQKWMDGPPMPTAVSRAAAAVWDMECLVTGGLESRAGRTVNGRAVQMYNRRMSMWTLGPELPEPRHGHTCTVLDGTVYAVGGECGNAYAPTAKVVALKTGAKSWVSVAPLPQARAFQATVAFRGKLYVFGNRGPAPHPCKYDPASDRWTELACADIETHRTAYALAEGKVYFFGGEGGPAQDRVFDLATETWVR